MMNKKIRLFDYRDRPKEFIIKDFEKVKECFFQILSGDGVLTIFYEDNTKVEFDSGEHRYIDYYDGSWIIPPKHIGLLNKMKSHYDTDKLDEMGF